MNKLSTIIGIILIVFLSSILVIVANIDRTIVSSNINAIANDNMAENAKATLQLDDEIYRAVQAGRIMLKNSPPLKDLGNKKQISLAIFNPSTHNVTEHRYELDVSNEKYTGVVSLLGEDKNAPLVSISYWNGYNSTYEVSSPSGAVVVANKYPVKSSNLGQLPEKKSSPYSDIVYVPFSESLSTPIHLVAGEKYLDEIIAKAYSELDKNSVMSIANPGELITAQVPRELVKTIILIEHIDPSSFLSAPDGGRELLERVLAILGTNKETAYRYSISPAGASGISQFIRPTYKSMVESYPKAQLIPEYTVGTTTHVNAVKAMVCFFDTHIKQIREYIADYESEKPIHLTEEMLAATYNGGPFRVSQAISKHGMAWIYSQLDDSGTKKMFPRETIDYVRKFSAIRNLLKK